MALVVRDSTLIVEALTRLRATLPFRLLGFDTDNGSEFLNETVVAYCAAQQIEFTRPRPYRKNDQACAAPSGRDGWRHVRVGYHLHFSAAFRS